MNAIMPRATIEQIAGVRDAALQLYELAYAKILEADEAIKTAHSMAANAHPGINRMNFDHAEEIKAFYGAVNLPDRFRYLRTAKRILDINCWAWVIERTELERLMDKDAKDKLRRQMAYVPERVGRDGELINEEEIARGLPEFTVETVYATIQQFMADSDNIFRRGIANAFSKLDRRFKSHDGFKLGSRIILTRAFDEYGWLSHWSDVGSTLIDIERVFAILDGHAEGSFTSTLYRLERDRADTWQPTQSETESDYFRVRVFKNGNAHLWFRRDDLVEKVNKLLAEYYGEVIGDSTQDDGDPFSDIKTTPARYYGFFPTPEEAAAHVMDRLQLSRERGAAPLTVLEPSAGTGNLARRAAREMSGYEGGWGKDRVDFTYRAIVDCVELQQPLAQGLKAEGLYRRVYAQDFLALSPETTGLYDRVVMNPPFDRERDIDHVVHALKFLKPGGQLVAIMSAGTEFRETRKAIAFRELVASLKGDFRELPAGSFSEVGTNVNTVVLTVWKDGQKSRW